MLVACLGWIVLGLEHEPLAIVAALVITEYTSLRHLFQSLRWALRWELSGDRWFLVVWVIALQLAPVYFFVARWNPVSDSVR